LRAKRYRQSESSAVANRHAVRFYDPNLHSPCSSCRVLKITQSFGKNGLLTIKLEGEILGPWVSVLHEACTERDACRQRLDLAGVSYVDGAGAQLLRDLLNEGAEIAACSTFIRELLPLQQRGES
jgi:hypothetical protein